MVSYLFLLLALFVFMVILDRLRLVTKVKRCIAEIGAAVAVMRAVDVREEDKERAIRRATLRMGGAFLDILARSAAALSAPAALIWAGIAAGFYSSAEALAAASEPFFLIALTVLAVVMLGFAR